MKEQRIISRVGNVCEATKNHHKSWEGNLWRNKESSQELGMFVKQQKNHHKSWEGLWSNQESSQELEAWWCNENHHKSWKLCRPRIIRVGSFLRARGFLGFDVVCFFRFMVMSAFGNCCVGFCSWRIQWGREGGREGGARRVRTRRNASVYVGCGVGERGRQCDPSGGACWALHTGVGAAAGDAQNPGRCGFLSNKTITHQNFYNLAPFSWLLASLVGTFLCSSYIVA